MIDILVVEPEAGRAQTLAGMVHEVTDQRVTPVPTLPEAWGAGTEVVIIGPSPTTDEALSITAQVLARTPDAGVILVRSEVSTELLRHAMRAGVADVVGTDETPFELPAAVERAVTQAVRRHDAVPVDSPKPKRGTTITVFSTKGGVGKTVLAINLGVALVSMGRSVVLVDLDLQFGDVGIMLGLEPTLTISGPAQASDRLDTELLSGYLVEHSSGLKCLLAPVQPEEAESITPGRIARILELLAEMFDVVVVDTCASLDETVLTALDRSDHLLAMTMMDVASIKNTRISLQKLHQLGYDGHSVQVVLNRADSKVFLQPAQIEKAIGREISVRIPSDRIVPQSVNKGVPVVSEFPRSEVSRALMGVARQFIDVHEKAVSSHVA